jgi:antitoxin (DNA-binding transcriptional repressor) of toxin-antitoxin stability system
MSPGKWYGRTEVCTVRKARRRLTQLVDDLEAKRTSSVLILSRGKLVAALVRRPDSDEWEKNWKNWVGLRRRSRPPAREPDQVPWWSVSEARKEFSWLLELIQTDEYPAIVIGRAWRYEPAVMIPPEWVRNQLLDHRPRALLEVLLPL